MACARARTKRHRIFERQGLRSDQRGVFTEAMAGDDLGGLATGRAPGPKDGDVCGQHDGLSITRAIEFSSGPGSQAPRVLSRIREASSKVSLMRISRIATIMPIDCEPCPGKTNASFTSRLPHELEPTQGGAPGESAADTFQQHALSGPMRPSRTASSSARGIDAADVLPWRSTVTTTWSMGRPSFLAVASMMRTLA